MTGQHRGERRTRRQRRHPAEILSEQLADVLDTYAEILTDEERLALSVTRRVLHRLADEGVRRDEAR